jgi:hypothetical protein
MIPPPTPAGIMPEIDKLLHVAISRAGNDLVKTYYITNNTRDEIEPELSEQPSALSYISKNASRESFDIQELNDLVTSEVYFQNKTFGLFNNTDITYKDSTLGTDRIFVAEVKKVFIETRYAFAQIFMEYFDLNDDVVPHKKVKEIDDVLREKGIYHNDLNKKGNKNIRYGVRHSEKGVVILDYGAAYYTIRYSRGGTKRKPKRRKSRRKYTRLSA